MRFGLDDIQPGQESTNAERVIYELTDLCAIIEMLGEEGLIDPSANPRPGIDRKKAKVEHYIEYAKERGTLTA